MAGATGISHSIDGGKIGCGITGLGGRQTIGGGLAALKGIPILPDGRQGLAVADIRAFGGARRQCG